MSVFDDYDVDSPHGMEGDVAPEGHGDPMAHGTMDGHHGQMTDTAVYSDDAAMPDPAMYGHGAAMPHGATGTDSPAAIEAGHAGQLEVAPSADDIAQARHDLGAPANAAVGAQQEIGTPPPPATAEPVPADAGPAGGDAPPQPQDPAQSLEQAKQDAQQTQETAQMLSQIADIRHQTAMSIIGNMR